MDGTGTLNDFSFLFSSPASFFLRTIGSFARAHHGVLKRVRSHLAVDLQHPRYCLHPR